jgi:Lrp/AsnC family transcriptional regulator for asnA, asnC and gidA
VARYALDLVDEAILEALQGDGRRSFRDIARGIGVSEGTVRARVRRLQEAGVLRVLAFVDPSRLGKSVLALITARVDPEHQSRVVDACTAWPETTYVSSLIGRADIYMQVICADNETLWGVVNRLRALPGVTETETMLEMEVHKFAYRDLAARDRGEPDA